MERVKLFKSLNEPCSSFTLVGKFSILNGSAELDIVRS